MTQNVGADVHFDGALWRSSDGQYWWDGKRWHSVARPPIIDLRLLAYSAALGFGVLIVVVIFAAAVAGVPSADYTLLVASLAASLVTLAALSGVALKPRPIVATLVPTAIASCGPFLLLFVLAVYSMLSWSPISCSDPNAPANCDNDTGLAVGLLLGGVVTVGLWVVMACVGVGARFIDKKLSARR